jgi:hypothetical protein
MKPIIVERRKMRRRHVGVPLIKTNNYLVEEITAIIAM